MNQNLLRPCPCPWKAKDPNCDMYSTNIVKDINLVSCLNTFLTQDKLLEVLARMLSWMVILQSALSQLLRWRGTV